MRLTDDFESFPELMTTSETAEFLRIPRPTVYYLINKGELPAVRISGRWRIRRSLVEEKLNLSSDRGAAPVVLAVEDDPHLQALYRAFFKQLGFIAVVVGTATEALKQARHQDFNLAFLDLQLPDLSGDELFLRLKQIHPALPVAIVTGFPESHMLESILKVEPLLVLRKPVDQNVLNRAAKFLAPASLAREVAAAG